ncbi:hypothetical protein FBQ97_16895 [Acidobacteria bacterium ACD]|nr:MAG: hypothetical protein EDX89_03380 [Acidobacteriota bacterium]MCE7959655.1 hypothetical protein [Acidobacteria bacterium ACB2]MDL1951473.1 hypothetical protein [Acidobacteria bacterium ACD]
MNNVNLVLTIPHGSLIATSLGLEGLAWHLSPGSGRHFRGRSIFVDLALAEGKAGFSFLPEGGWRDAGGDTTSALEDVKKGKRTKTALSNNAFSAVPIDAWRSCSLVKTEGQLATLDPAVELIRYPGHACSEEMSPADVARAIGQPEPAKRAPRLYAVLAPIELLMISNLTPAEYAWYATHRRGKVFRQVCFTELRKDQTQLAAHARFEEARAELSADPRKKTKSITVEGLLNEVPFRDWIGCHREAEGGVYVGDRDHLVLFRFPETLPPKWEKAN